MADKRPTSQECGSGEEAPVEEKDWTISRTVFTALNDKSTIDEAKPLFEKHILALAEKFKVAKYQILLLLDEKDGISNWHSDRIYHGASVDGGERDIFLVIYSHGGSIEPAYLISKTCKRLSKKKFVVGVPRKAKSAATLITLGADEIHMGLMTELGPIDPQFGGLPALGMQNALNLLAELCCKHPGASEMLGKYLSEKLSLNILGYFNRISQSAAQYAERLLEGKSLPKDQNPKQLGDHFVNHYLDHSFVIDADEAEKLLSNKIVRQNTDEYGFANAVYESLNLIRHFTRAVMNKDFDYVGSVGNGLYLREFKSDL